MKKYKVALIHNIMSPYRIPLFEKISNSPHINLITYFCSKTHVERKWDILDSDKYKYEILTGTTIEYSGIIYHINPSIIVKLIKEKYDIVIIGGSSDFTTQAAFVCSRLLRIPVILWSENIGNSESSLVKIVSPFTKYIIRNVDALIVPGFMSRDFHIKCGVSPKNIFIAPNSVNNNIFMKENSRPHRIQMKNGLNIEGKKVILFVGQLIERKGLWYLLKSYKKLSDEIQNVCMIIVGDGCLKNDLSSFCVKENIKNVKFTGWVSDIQKCDFYSIADVFVLPTLHDVWGLVINEAMASGLPVITTKSAGASEDRKSVV